MVLHRVGKQDTQLMVYSTLKNQRIEFGVTTATESEEGIWEEGQSPILFINSVHVSGLLLCGGSRLRIAWTEA